MRVGGAQGLKLSLVEIGLEPGFQNIERRGDQRSGHTTKTAKKSATTAKRC